MRRKRTMEMYMEAGACLRVLKNMGAQAIVESANILPKKDVVQLANAMNKIHQVISRAEDHMFQDFPNLDDTALRVFYGNLNHEPRNEMDEQIIAKAKQKTNELFGE